jgi:hypothetical protein
MKTKSMKTKSMKTKKYYYSYLFKKGDYIDVSSTLENKFPKHFTGSGTSLLDGSYDVGFLCSAEQAQKITQYIKRNFPWTATRHRSSN